MTPVDMVLAVLGDRLPDDVVAAASAVRRVGGPDESPIVAVAGGTGSGKSSLVNALAGRAVTEVGVLRPTTSEVVAVLPEHGAAPAVLDQLGVLDRPRGTQRGVVVCDLPDLDSMAEGHRDAAAAVLDHADGVVWVVDPEKYADAVVHAAMARWSDLPGPVVCAHADRLTGSERLAVADDLRRLVGGREVLLVSLPPEGGALGVVEVADRVSRIRRLGTDHAGLAATVALVEAVGPHPDPLPGSAWGAKVAEVDAHVAGLVAEASQRLVGDGRRRAVLGRPLPPRPHDPGPSPDLAPPTSWEHPTPVTDAALAGWVIAADALGAAIDGAAAMARSEVVPPRTGWRAARRGAVGLSAIAIVVAAVLAPIPWWVGPVVAGAIMATAWAYLDRSGTAAGEAAAGTLAARVDAMMAGSTEAPPVVAHAARCAELDAAVGALSRLADGASAGP